MHQLRERSGRSEGSAEGSAPRASSRLGCGGVSWQARAADGAPTALSPGEAFAALKSGKRGRYL